MKYYKIGRGGEETKYPEPRLFGEWEEEPLFSNDWENRELKLPVTMTCRCTLRRAGLENRELKLPVTMTVKNKYNPGDYPLAGSKLVSQKLLDVIKQLNKDYEALPTRLYYKEKEPIWDVYYSMIFPEYEVLNLKKSKYTSGIDYGIDDIGVISIDKIVLSKEKLSHVDVANNIFAMEEASTLILCTEIAKDMIEAAGIKDVRFTELPVE